jgi:hypothetical protein
MNALTTTASRTSSHAVNAFAIEKRLALAIASLTLQNLRERKTETTIAGHSVLCSGATFTKAEEKTLRTRASS